MTSSPPPPPRRDDPRMQTVEMAALRYEEVIESETLDSGPVHHESVPWRVALLVAAGGALGAMLRFGLTVLAPTVTTPTLVELPWATLGVNLLGCLGLGLLNGMLEVRAHRPWLQPLLGTGLCGGFTSFSSVVLEGSAMIGADFPVLAMTYTLATVIVCLAGIVLGLLGGRRLARRQLARRAADAEGTT
ncbi:MAG: fluoride efflux transporter FluC [Brachybacterium sp.]|uniref:fluoride efflux transporter FluC n=1 Tax=Brachybacterium sp. TaxID=1891286 RepID=UPI0026545AE1|nr:CrcB family protein [Brachybacterium sp.]MDN6302884.1 CrcB family protein [Brachybacterium sp.]MDN6328033.1 CrcB family protein [Brachybacterium sp.]